MKAIKAPVCIVIAMSFMLARVAGAQNAEPIATQKYQVRLLSLPFHARLVGMDDAGDVVAQAANAGFIWRPGDTTVELWPTPDNSGGTVQPFAMNGRGEVVVQFFPKEGQVLPWGTSQFIFSNQNRTFRPYGNTQYTRGCDSAVSAYNNSGQMFCGVEVTQIIVPSLGPVGSFDLPPALPSITKVACPDHGPAIALGENDKGKFVGSCLSNCISQDPKCREILQHGFIYDSTSGTMSVLDYPGAFKTIANTITDAGIVIGTYQAKGSHGAFSYDGARFTDLEGTDADKPGVRIPMDAELFVGNSLGAIIGIPRSGQTYIAVPFGRAFPKVAETLDSTRVWGMAHRSKTLHVASVNKPDPNFGFNSSEYSGHGFALHWSYTRSDGEPNLNEGEYVGFNEQGSWFVQDGFLYRWNTQSKTFTCVLENAPGDLHKTALTQTEIVSAMSNAKPVQPTRGSQGKVTKFADGNLYLSYYVDQANGSSVGMVLKVVRPVNDAPAALPAAKAGAGTTGSWVYIGEGAQAAVAALMNLDGNGTVTWTFMEPATARKYLAP